MHMLKPSVVWEYSMEPVKISKDVRLGQLRMPDGGVLCTCLLILSSWCIKKLPIPYMSKLREKTHQSGTGCS